MSMMFYGAARLADTDSHSQAELRKYWRELERLHSVRLTLDAPTEQYLEPCIAALWKHRAWFRFSLLDVDQGPNGTSDRFLSHAALEGQRVLKIHPALPPERVWPRVPQWRFLNFMFWHELLTEGYLVIEHTSGDSATLECEKEGPLTDTLQALWIKYCWDTSSEDPSLYHIDLSLLPR